MEDENEQAGRDRKRSRRDHAEEKSTTSRKEEDYEQARRDRKRSRREYTEEPSSATSHTQNDKHSISSSSRQQQQHSSSHKPAASTSSTSYIPKGPAASTKPPEQPKRENPAIDPHELERQARNKERMQKELQRREAMEGKAPTGPRGSSSSKHQNGGAAPLGRRVSYKYEDDLDGNERVEREREAGRWG